MRYSGGEREWTKRMTNYSSAAGVAPVPDSVPTNYTYAIGDLHGEVRLLCQLLEAVAPTPRDQLIFLGDYLDRGEDSVALIAYLLELNERLDCVWLRGNHDEVWLEQWTGERFEHCPVIPGARAVWEQCQGAPPAFIGHFLQQTRLSYEDGYAWYAHAGAQPGVPFWETPEHVYVWGMQGFLTTSYDWGKPVVFGHTELNEPLVTPTKIGLDTAAYRTGTLTAMRMPTRELIQVHRHPDA